MGDKLGKLIAESMAIEAEDAKQAGAVGFMARALTQATMPHKGNARITNLPARMGFQPYHAGHPDKSGCPTGRFPGLLVSWVTTEAVRTKSPILELGPSLSAFMAELDLDAYGGPMGKHHQTAGPNDPAFSPASVPVIYDDKDNEPESSTSGLSKSGFVVEPESARSSAAVEINH
jgi:hypothetical protein